MKVKVFYIDRLGTRHNYVRNGKKIYESPLECVLYALLMIVKVTLQSTAKYKYIVYIHM